MKRLATFVFFGILLIAFIFGKFLSIWPKKVQGDLVSINPATIYLTKLSALSSVLSNPDLQNSVLTATLASGLTIILDIANPKANWETTLQSILSRSKITGESPEIIDMRFKMPIITYGQK
jgi:hypothetical protein